MDANPAAPELSCPLPAEDGIHLSTDGVVKLKWSDTGAQAYQLEHRVGNGDYQLRYTGTDLASVRTGLAGGKHHFRVRSLDRPNDPGEWTEIRVRVEYMDAGRVRILLITGGIVVLSTIGTILHGHLTHRKEDTA